MTQIAKSRGAHMGYIWVHLGTNMGPIWAAHMGTIWAHMGPTWPIWDPYPFCTVQSDWGPYGPSGFYAGFIWALPHLAHVSQYKTYGAHILTTSKTHLGPIWANTI